MGSDIGLMLRMIPPDPISASLAIEVNVNNQGYSQESE